MSLWSNVDANTAAPKWSVAAGLGLSANGFALTANTTLGVFGVTNGEQQSETVRKGAHAGWVLQQVGTGGRAGRVMTETLVAMGSMTDDSDAATVVNRIIKISRQPGNASNTAGGNASFNVAASATPSTTLTYQWYSNGAIITGATANVLNLTNVQTQNNYYVIVGATDATSVKSANGVLTITP